MRRSRCRTTYIVTAFGLGVLLSLVCPSELLLIVTLFVLVIASISGMIC